MTKKMGIALYIILIVCGLIVVKVVNDQQDEFDNQNYFTAQELSTLKTRLDTLEKKLDKIDVRTLEMLDREGIYDDTPEQKQDPPENPFGNPYEQKPLENPFGNPYEQKPLENPFGNPYEQKPLENPFGNASADLHNYVSINESKKWLRERGYEIMKSGDEYHLARQSFVTTVSNRSGTVALQDGTLIKTDASGVRVSPHSNQRTYTPPRNYYLSVAASKDWLTRRGYKIMKSGDEYHLARPPSVTTVSNKSGIVTLPDGTLIKADASGVRISPHSNQR